jgi:hypothetical protein
MLNRWTIKQAGELYTVYDCDAEDEYDAEDKTFARFLRNLSVRLSTA